jgi:ribonuclease P/MRP protein subunit POP5
MVRYKCRWILFELVQDPVLQNDEPVDHRTPIELNEQMIQRSLREAILTTFGDYGAGLLRGSHGKWRNLWKGKSMICTRSLLVFV